MINLSMDYLKAMLVCVPTHEVRYYLCGINFVGVKNKVSAYATDGHRISKWLITEEYDGNDFNIIIKKDAIKAIISSKDSHAELEPTTGAVTTSFGSITGLIDGKYPNVDRVLNKETVVTKDGACPIDSKYIFDTIKIANIICGKGSRDKIKQYNSSPDSTVVFTFHNVDDFIHGIMPLRESWDSDNTKAVVSKMLNKG